MKRNKRNAYYLRAHASAAYSPSGPSLFPNELLQNIFQYIGPYDLLFNIACVCKRWRVVAKEKSLWRTCTLQDENFEGQADLSLLALVPALHGLHLRTGLAPGMVFRALLHGSKDLHSLSLHFREGCLSVLQLKLLLPHFPSLYHIDLQLPAASHDQELYTAFHPLQKLKSLQLNGFVSPVSELIYALTTHCLALHTLHLVECLISFRDDHLVALVSDGRPWQSLKLVTYFISEAAYGYFAQLVHLRELSLVKCKSLTEEGLLRIATLPHLHTLSLSENCILNPAALATCFQYDTMAQLQEVDITVYRADDRVAMVIATTCTQLVRLRLAMCLLTDEGVRSIILNAIHLTDLDLEFNNIRGKWLYLIPSHLPHLTRLNLHLCYNVLMNLNEIVARQTALSIIDPTGAVIGGRSAKSVQPQ